MFRFSLVLCLVLCGLSLGYGDDMVTASPHGSFKIIQHWKEDDLRGENWRQTIQFGRNAAQIVTLERGISWSAEYYISPDERWILRIQKSGSGENISWLYRLDNHNHHRIRRMEKQIGELGFDYLAQRSNLPLGLYHTGINFVSWDLKKGLLHFTIHGDADQQSDGGIDCPLIYDLRRGIIKEP